MPVLAILDLIGIDVATAAGAASLYNIHAAASALTVVAAGGLNAAGAVVNCKKKHSCRKFMALDESSIPQNITTPSERATMRMASRQVGACGVPQYNFDMCQNDLKNIVVHTSIPSPGVAQLDNVPPTCMVLSTVILGGCGIAPPYPLICGSACMQYTGLSDEQMEKLGDFLGRYSH